jgi:hypothetical protein
MPDSPVVIEHSLLKLRQEESDGGFGVSSHQALSRLVRGFTDELIFVSQGSENRADDLGAANV